MLGDFDGDGKFTGKDVYILDEILEKDRKKDRESRKEGRTPSGCAVILFVGCMSALGMAGLFVWIV